jgi:hypothetical protein
MRNNHMPSSALYLWMITMSQSFSAKGEPKRMFFSRYASLYHWTKPRRNRSFLLENRIKGALANWVLKKNPWTHDEFFAVASGATCHHVKPRKRTNSYQVRLRIKERQL